MITLTTGDKEEVFNKVVAKIAAAEAPATAIRGLTISADQRGFKSVTVISR